MKTKIAACLIGLGLLTGCSQEYIPPPDTVTVVKKKTTISDMEDDGGPETQKWFLIYEHFDGYRDTESIRVTEEMYDDVSVGDKFCRPALTKGEC